ncbi:lactate utilization protein B/C [bacterium]|nr:lactate utilization protein B/C [bacterium]
MNFFKNIFKKNNQFNKTSSSNKDEKSSFMPKIETPTDNRFVQNFIKNGGKFLYSENENEVNKNITLIIEENSWKKSNLISLDKNISKRFRLDYSFSKDSKDETICLISTCEYLIADDGSILVSSNQVAEKKLDELPGDIIILAKTDQLINNISEGLSGIKNNSKSIPSNITNLKHFKDCNDKDFLSYGSSSKNLYLILLENQ